MIRNELEILIEKAVKKIYNQEVNVKVDRPQDSVFGDYSSNIAIILKKDANEIAKEIKSEFLERVEVKNNFINFFISKEYLQKQVKEILKEKENFGTLKIGCKQKVNIEFISANPTGPLTLGNGRGGFCGDVLANILSKARYKVEREYYVNDAGEQVRKLGHSILGDAEAVYKGEYIDKLREELKDVKVIRNGDVMKVGKEAAKIILEKMIKPSVKKMGVEFDNWFSEQSLYDKGEVDKSLEFLEKPDKSCDILTGSPQSGKAGLGGGLTYDQDGALWFKSTEFGDDKDRVLIKENGEKTYLASDIAYLKNKFNRGFEKLIFYWGADHYGYIERIKAAAVALGYKKEQVEVQVMQLVRLIQGGQEVKMSKRSGIYVTIDELIDEVGLDVARFFFLSKSAGVHLNFDLDLAKEQSDKNPVYYVQYAHARICSIIEKIKEQNSGVKAETKNLEFLKEPSELNLIKQLIRFPEIIEDTAKDYQLQRLPQYVTDLATSFHQFYRDCRVIQSSDESGSTEEQVSKKLSSARLTLILATKIVLENALKIMGISAPEKM
jgi:arginyl-tRNA synthetase